MVTTLRLFVLLFACSLAVRAETDEKKRLLRATTERRAAEDEQNVDEELERAEYAPERPHTPYPTALQCAVLEQDCRYDFDCCGDSYCSLVHSYCLPCYPHGSECSKSNHCCGDDTCIAYECVDCAKEGEMCYRTDDCCHTKNRDLTPWTGLILQCIAPNGTELVGHSLKAQGVCTPVLSDEPTVAPSNKPPTGEPSKAPTRSIKMNTLTWKPTVPNVCFEKDEPCENYYDCCADLFCSLKTNLCRDCVDRFAPCTRNIHCCGDMACVDKQCTNCIPEGEICRRTDDCCTDSGEVLVCRQGSELTKQFGEPGVKSERPHIGLCLPVEPGTDPDLWDGDSYGETTTEE